MSIKNVIVIGGGIAGASISRFLAKAGVKVTLLEKSGMLCSGSTWHAAGLVTRYAGSPKLKKIHVRSLQLLTELENKYGIGLHLPGSIRIIEKGDEDRMREAEQQAAMALLFDDPLYKTDIISAEEVRKLHPLIDENYDIGCGVYTPHDGDVDPTSLTNVVMKEAREHGASLSFNANVIGVDRCSNGGFKIKFQDMKEKTIKSLECDAVINAAGLWSRNISSIAPVATNKEGLHHPAFVIEHQYAITETIPAVKSLSESGHNGGRLPVLRDLKGSSYIRQEGNGFLIGPYEDECIVRRDMPFGPPSTFEMELFPDNLERIEDNLMLGMELIPCLGEVGFKTIVNGPTIWTGDSTARCGESALPGWYDFNSLTYGIAQSLALSEYLGHVILEGEQPAGFDASDIFSPLRYNSSWANDDYTEAKIKETYTHNNKIVYNYENRSAGRLTFKQPYPLHSVLESYGAKFGAFGGSGCEIPICYPPIGSPVDFHDSKRFSNFEWADYANDEAKHVLSHVGISYSSFSKLRLNGPDALKFMEEVTTGVLPKRKKIETGNDLPCRLTYCTTPKGQVATEFTICRMNDIGDDWYIVGSRDHVQQDMFWLQKQIKNRDIKIENMTDKMCVLHLMGPESGNLLGAIEPRIDNLDFMRAREIKDFAGIRDANVSVFRLSFSGQMGYELHFFSEYGPCIHEKIVSNEIAKTKHLRHIGSAAINSLRIEQGFKFRADLDFAHYTEAGISAFLSKKRQFLGKCDSVKPKRLSAMFQIKALPGWKWSILGDTPITKKCDGSIIGYTTTSARGAISNEAVAMGYTLNDVFDQEKWNDDEELEINSFGFKWPVKFLKNPIANIDRTVWNKNNQLQDDNLSLMPSNSSKTKLVII